MFLLLFSAAIGLYEGLRVNPYVGGNEASNDLFFSKKKQLARKNKNKAKPKTGLYFSKPKVSGSLFDAVDLLSPCKNVTRLSCR